MNIRDRDIKPVTENEIKNDTASRHFSLDEAVSHMHLSIHAKAAMRPSFYDIGTVVGVLHMNDEIELVVKFHDHIEQLTKRELLRGYVKESFPLA